MANAVLSEVEREVQMVAVVLHKTSIFYVGDHIVTWCDETSKLKGKVPELIFPELDLQLSQVFVCTELASSKMTCTWGSLKKSLEAQTL